MLLRISTCLLMVLGTTVPSSYSQHNFPDELQNILTGQSLASTGAIGDNVPGFTGDLGTWFQYFDFSAGFSVNYVLCYRLGADSLTDSNGNIIPMTGSAFVYCRGSYELDELQTEPQFFLFLQNVVPDVTSVFPIKQATIDLRLTTEAAFFDGFGEYCFFDSKGFDCLDDACEGVNSTLFSAARPLICLSGCCGIGAKIRLPGVDYVDNGVGQAEFAFSDSFEFGEPDFRRFFEHFSFFVGLEDIPKLEPLFSSQQFEIPLFQPGDTNFDGSVDLLDVSLFVACLVGGNYQFQCDINGDLIVDLQDVDPFVDLLAN